MTPEEIAREIVEKIEKNIEDCDGYLYPAQWVALVRPVVEEHLGFQEQRCIKHAAYTADSECVFCDRDIEAERAQAAEKERDELKALVSGAVEGLRRSVVAEEDLRAEVERLRLDGQNDYKALFEADYARAERFSRRVRELEAGLRQIKAHAETRYEASYGYIVDALLSAASQPALQAEEAESERLSQRVRDLEAGLAGFEAPAFAACASLKNYAVNLARDEDEEAGDVKAQAVALERAWGRARALLSTPPAPQLEEPR